MKKVLIILIIILLQASSVMADNFNNVKRIMEGDKNAKITILVYESLTCSHCANFHINVFPDLKKDYIDTGIVKIEFRHFPLDVAALNASKVSQCKNDGETDILNSLYLNQSKWIKGATLEKINKNLEEFLKTEGINLNFDKCIKNKNLENFILNDRVEGAKKFKINATPTIIINGKKFEKSLNYKNLKKSLEKLI